MSAEPSVRRVRVLVSGRVQGVYYRASTAEQGRVLGLSGWVCNLPDGRVALEAEGASEAVLALLGWLERGPPAARVDGLEVDEREPLGEGGPFEVRR